MAIYLMVSLKLGVGNIPSWNIGFQKLTEESVKEGQKLLVFKSLSERISRFWKKLHLKTRTKRMFFLLKLHETCHMIFLMYFFQFRLQIYDWTFKDFFCNFVTAYANSIWKTVVDFLGKFRSFSKPLTSLILQTTACAVR